MSNCTQTRRGNLYESKLPPSGTYNASVERVCQDEESFSKQYSSFTSNVRPDNPQAITRSLEQDTRKEQGLLGNMANMLRSVLGGPSQSSQSAPPQQQSRITELDDNRNLPTFNLHQQDWPTPQFEEDHPAALQNTTASTGGTRTVKKQRRTHKKRKSSKRRVSKKNQRKSHKKR